MKNTFLRILVATILLFSICSIAKAQDKDQNQESISTVYALFDEINMANSFDTMIENMLDLQIKQNPSIASLRHVMLKFMKKHMGWESMKLDMAKIYLESFTVEEIKILTNFYKTPLGKKTAKLIPKLASQGAELGQKRVQDNVDELKRMITEELKKQESGKQ